MRADNRREGAEKQEQAVFANLVEVGDPDGDLVKLGMEPSPRIQGTTVGRERHRHDHLGGPSPGVRDEDRIREHHREHAEQVALDDRQEMERIIFSDAPEHQGILGRREESQDDSAKRVTSNARSWLKLGFHRLESEMSSGSQQAQHQSMKQNRDRVDRVDEYSERRKKDRSRRPVPAPPPGAFVEAARAVSVASWRSASLDDPLFRG